VRSKTSSSRNYSYVLLILGLGFLNAGVTHLEAAQTIPLNTQKPTRWLEVRQTKGSVSVKLIGSSSRVAKMGDRLDQQGEQITTAKGAETMLAIDNGIAIVRLTEETTLQVKQLSVNGSGGYITLLSVPKGMARLQVRPLTNPSTRLQIQTPAGIAGVRGTEFGVGIAPNGRTAIATNEGAVNATAQGQSVLVGGGFFSVVPLGEPPTPPQLSKGDVRLKVESLEVLPETVGRSDGALGRIIGSVEAANIVYLNGQSIDLDKQGAFNQLVKLLPNNRLVVLVRSPFGPQQSYNLAVPQQPYRFPK
jgi:FecR protein